MSKPLEFAINLIFILEEPVQGFWKQTLS